ncbi:MAG TPA: ATP-binding protein [Solirubrobacteraceae bacterium]|nr:ATP-binding protein [Solirubrobacteraceae bacterium]
MFGAALGGGDQPQQVALVDTQLDRIFQRFLRVDATRPRDSGETGIGVSIVRAIVEAHGGSVIATSDGIGHGAIFTVRLPMQQRLGA